VEGEAKEGTKGEATEGTKGEEKEVEKAEVVVCLAEEEMEKEDGGEKAGVEGGAEEVEMEQGV
jgi:hypothetical protein